MEDKAALRARALASRAGRTADAAAVRAALADLLDVGLVASYVPGRGEPGLEPEPGWLLPVLLADGDLDWAAYDGTLVPGRRGLSEPAGPRLGRDAVGRAALVLVPALLVDRRGTRLGRGGGSYDRALPRTRGLAVAVLHDGELVDALPAEPHDAPVDAVVSPLAGLVRLSGRMPA